MNGVGVNVQKLLTFIACLALAACTAPEDIDSLTAYVAPPGSAASVVSHNIPATLSPGEKRVVTVTMMNDGTDPVLNIWTPSTARLIARVPRFWKFPHRFVTTDVNPGETHDFTFTLTAPDAAGTYPLRLSMYQSGYFGEEIMVDIDVTDTSDPIYDCEFDAGASTIPTTMAPGSSTTTTIVVNNTGTATWVTPGFSLYSRDSPASFWGNTIVNLSADTAMGASATFNVPITAPTTPGTYTFSRQIRDGTSGGVGVLPGSCVSVSITVGGAVENDAAVVSNDLPTEMGINESFAATIVMQNTGTSTWTAGTTFALYKTGDGFGTTLVYVDTDTAPLANFSFSVAITAPSSAGTYDNNWRMRQLGTGGGYFGEELEVSVNVGAAGSTIDLAMDSSDRGFIGSRGSNQLSNMGAGDFNNDGTTDLVVAERSSPSSPTFSPFRNASGSLFGFAGGGGFFSGSSTLPTGNDFIVVGADTGDRLGELTTRILIGDVSGDGIGDVIASAPLADGDANGRTNAGEVYILSGALLTGVIDLAADPAPTAILARIIGANAGDEIRAIGVADFTGSSAVDLVIGAPKLGSDAGGVYILSDVGSLSGDVDLSSASIAVTITGGAASDQLGRVGYVGDVSGSAAADLLLGAPLADPGGRSSAGEAYLFVGPVSSGAVSTADTTWRGRDANERLGTSLAAGNVAGDSATDVLIGAIQYRRTVPLQSGGLYITEGGFGAGVIDYSSSSPDHVIIGADQYDNLGAGVTVGAIAGDGYDDIIVSASTADGPTNGLDRAGEMMVILGDAAMPATIDTLTTAVQALVFGDQDAALLGHYPTAVLSADLNGDGDDDVCVGSYRGGGAGRPGRVDCFLNATLQ